MPELPEVEVTRRRIAPLLLHRRIAQVRTTKASYFYLTDPAIVRRGLSGRQVCALTRAGKYLIADLDDGKRLLLHLGMTGQLFSSEASSVRLLSASRRQSLAPEAQPGFAPDHHTHFALAFDDDGPGVCFRDVRKFGKLRLLERGQSDPRIDRLGPDALLVEPDALFERSRGRTLAVKALLLDQSVLAGVGNIYADEALFRAGVRPTRRAGQVRRREYVALVAALRQVLERSIETGGSSISDYVAPDGQDGAYQDERQVYARGGEPCLRCATPIRRIVVGQRSTHYCPRCQV